MEELTTEDLQALYEGLQAKLKTKTTEELLAMMRRTDTQLVAFMFGIELDPL
jgi:hypothetical protein